jgi:hypothetical protein
MAKSHTVHTPGDTPRMNHISFPSVKIAEFGRVDPSSGWIKFQSSLPKGFEKLFDLMGWDVPGDKTMSEKLEGKLEGGHLILTAKDKLIEAEVDIEYVAMTDFSCLRLELEGRKGKGFRRELRFNVKFKQQDACALLESYQFQSDNARGSLKVTYMIEPVQTELVPDVQPPIEAPMFEDEVRSIKEKLDARNAN